MNNPIPFASDSPRSTLRRASLQAQAIEGAAAASRKGSVSTNSLAQGSPSPSPPPTGVAGSTPNIAAASAIGRAASPALSSRLVPTNGGLGPATSTAVGVRPMFKPFTLIEYKGMKFVIMDAPSDANLAQYLKELDKHKVTDMVRACEPTYSGDTVRSHGIHLHELNFKDGDPPPSHVVTQWLQLVQTTFFPSVKGSKDPPPSQPSEAPSSAIAVHCVAGLGRAPVLVAIALIEAGMQNLEAVEFVRSRRRGALNMKQIHFLDSYKRRGKGKLGPGAGIPGAVNGGGGDHHHKDKCAIM